MSRLMILKNRTEKSFWRVMMKGPNNVEASTNVNPGFVSRLLGVTVLVSILYGCGNVENSPQTAKIQNDSCDQATNVQDCQGFRDRLWRPILAVQSCNGCHVEGGTGVGEFADPDVVIAYNAITANENDPNLRRINRADPTNSFLVTKVRDVPQHGPGCYVQVAGVPDCVVSGERLASALQNWLDPNGGTNTNPASGDLGSVASRLENITQANDNPPVAEQIVLGSTTGADENAYATWIWGLTSNTFVSANDSNPTPNCGRCHSENAPQAQRQQPYFADSNLTNAFTALVETRKIDINNPTNSRLYLRLAQDSHNCWSNCSTDAATMLAAIQGWQTAILNSGSYTPPEVEGMETTLLTTSQGLELNQGQVISGGSRVTQGLIALWEFQEGTGNVAGDSSGVAPQIDLVLNENADWVGGWGIEFNPGGRATAASIANSQKLYDQIVPNNAFTLEAWVVPGNVSQEGPAIMASYSFSDTERNFSMGQTLYSYEFLNRNTASGLDVANRANGQPTLITDPDDEDLQATQQHVVMTYDATNGRRIYVNGVFTGDADTVTGGTLSDWDPSYVFTLGSDVGGANQWLGKIRMVAIYNRVLTDVEIQQNLDAGVGQKFHLLFKVGHLSDLLPDTSYIWFEVGEFDDYSYLFSNPSFIVLDPTDGSAIAPTSIGGLTIKGMRIGVNGKLAPVGQAFLNMDETVNMPDLTDPNNSQYVSLIGTTSATIDGTLVTDIPVKASGTIVSKQRGPNADPADQFYLTFENFAGETNVISNNGTPIALNYNYPDPIAGLANSNYIAGIRIFEEINATMAELTDIDVNNPAVKPTFIELQQQLPSGAALESFLASNQMGVAKLALTYCGELVDDASKLNAYFGGTINLATVFDTPTSQANIVNTLYDKMIGQNIAGQPTSTEVSNLLIGTGGLLEQLCPSGSCGATRNATILKSMCVSVLSSAAVTTQ